MTLHLIKLCVGFETPRDLAEWQDDHLKCLARAKKKPEHCHRTRQPPLRRGAPPVCAPVREALADDLH